MRMIVNVDVPELVPAIEFYTAALGFELTRRLDDDVAELKNGAALIYLLEKPAGSTPSQHVADRRGYTRHWTPVHFDIVVDDLSQAAERATRAGATRESGCLEWRGSKCITFSDPFGHGFCLIEFEGDTYA
ncbi:MAG TPA: VOC family protein [Gammaproteobacteria bacterium]